MSDSIIYAPAGNKRGEPIPIDMGYWAQLEARIQEVATVTPAKAPELLAVFNYAALELDRLANTLELEYQMAVREAERVRGEILLDKVPAILKAKGLATDRNPMGSEDMRQAVLSQDKDYQDALDRADMLKATYKMIRGKFDAFERAFRSVRTLVGETTFHFSNANLKGDAGAAALDERRTVPGFGTAKIG
jgi:hypothetical protein